MMMLRLVVALLFLVDPTAAQEKSTWTWYYGSTCSGALVTDMSWGIIPSGGYLPNPTPFAAAGSCFQFSNDPDAVWSECTNGVVTIRQYKGAPMANTCSGAQFSSYLDGGLTAISNGDCVSIDFSQRVAGAVPVSYRVTCISDNPCFPSSSIVNKADGTPTRLDALKEGDKIVSATAEGSLTIDTVSLLSISQPDDRDTFLTLSTEANRTLTVTGEHHLPVGAECCMHLRKAKEVGVGDQVWAVVDGKSAVATTVTAISLSGSGGDAAAAARPVSPHVLACTRQCIL